MHRNSIISGIKDLKSQPVLLDCQVADLSQVARINIAPCIALARRGPCQEGGEVALVFVRLDDISNAQGIDVGVEAAGEGACCFLGADFGEGIAGCVKGIQYW